LRTGGSYIVAPNIHPLVFVAVSFWRSPIGLWNVGLR
jgi:hypothetical protein